MGDSALFKGLSGRFPHEVTRRAAHGRARSELFRPFRFGPDEFAKALTPDDSYEIPDGDRGIKRDPACPTCGRIMNPGAMTRHKVATGHGAPDPRPENADMVAGFLAKAARPEQRYTFSPLYVPHRVDAHGEFATADDLQSAAWEYFRDSDRKLRKQHGKEVIGEVVEMVSWPAAHEADLIQADGSVRKEKLPSGTVYVGCVWTPSAWQSIKNGSLGGLSMGGSCCRVHGVPCP